MGRESSANEFDGCAWLHRRNKRSWLFRPDARYGRLVHITRRGTIYGIFERLSIGRPLWVSRLIDADMWRECTPATLNAHSIEFAWGGQYVF